MVPEIGDYNVKNKNRFQSHAQIPDNFHVISLLEKDSTISKSLLDGTTTDLTAVGKERGTLLNFKLDRVADSLVSQTVVEPKGYITELKTVKINTNTEVSDIKKARLLLRSLNR